MILKKLKNNKIKKSNLFLKESPQNPKQKLIFFFKNPKYKKIQKSGKNLWKLLFLTSLKKKKNSDKNIKIFF